MNAVKPHSRAVKLGESAKVLGKVFWAMVKNFNLKRKDQALLLGIKHNDQRLKDLESKQLIPEDIDKMNRVGNLLGIHKNLRVIYPYNRELVYGFFNQPWNYLDGKTPLEYLWENMSESYDRLFMIRNILDHIRVSR